MSPTSNSTINKNFVNRNVPTDPSSVESSPKLVSYINADPNPYTYSEERDVASAEKRLEAIGELVPKGDDLCKALSLMVDVVLRTH